MFMAKITSAKSVTWSDHHSALYILMNNNAVMITPISPLRKKNCSNMPQIYFLFICMNIRTTKDHQTWMIIILNFSLKELLKKYISKQREALIQLLIQASTMGQSWDMWKISGVQLLHFTSPLNITVLNYRKQNHLHTPKSRIWYENMFSKVLAHIKRKEVDRNIT